MSCSRRRITFNYFASGGTGFDGLLTVSGWQLQFPTKYMPSQGNGDRWIENLSVALSIQSQEAAPDNWRLFVPPEFILITARPFPFSSGDNDQLPYPDDSLAFSSRLVGHVGYGPIPYLNFEGTQLRVTLATSLFAPWNGNQSGSPVLPVDGVSSFDIRANLSFDFFINSPF